MDILVARGGHHFYSACLRDASESPVQPIAGPFGCLLWDARGGSTAAERGRLTRALIALGCATLVCGGTDAEEWHDAADERKAELEAVSGVESFVMTTWHTGQSMGEVAFYFATQANVDDRAIRTHLVLMIGGAAEEMRALTEVVRAEVVAPGWDIAGDAV